MNFRRQNSSNSGTNALPMTDEHCIRRLEKNIVRGPSLEQQQKSNKTKQKKRKLKPDRARK